MEVFFLCSRPANKTTVCILLMCEQLMPSRPLHNIWYEVVSQPVLRRAHLYLVLCSKGAAVMLVFTIWTGRKNVTSSLWPILDRHPQYHVVFLNNLLQWCVVSFHSWLSYEEKQPRGMKPASTDDFHQLPVIMMNDNSNAEHDPDWCCP